MLCSFDLLSFGFRWFPALPPAYALMRVGILDFPLFSLSMPPDARTRGPDPLEPFFWTFGAFLGPFGTLSLALAPSPLFLLFGRLQEQAPRPALSGRLALQAPRHWAPASAGAQSLFERRQGQAPNDWAPTPAGVLLASFGRRLLQAPSV